MQLAHFDVETFLRDYWQKQPLLIRNPWAQWTNPVDPDELAGLACEPGIEARLVQQKRKTWLAEHGPFPEERFSQLQRKPWTLLVQAVDHNVAEVATLLEQFRFLPNWRIDDVMVSYATDGGGVGPHYDQYDVFLIQGLGKRRWQVGAICDADTELLPHDELRLIANFKPVQEWVLEPGDILYLPPRFAHDGVAIGDDCMSYSIGFRAPARAELLAHWCDHLLAEMPDDDRYADPDLAPQANPGEITPAAIDRLRAMVAEKLDDPTAFARWFGEYTSTRKYPEVDWKPEEPATPAHIREALAEASPLCRNPASRFSFIRDGEAVLLFVDGHSHDCTGVVAELAEQLCAHERIVVAPAVAASDEAVALLATLFNDGSVAFDQDDDEEQE